MTPNPQVLLEKLGLTVPLIGFYDTPDPAPFEPLVRPKAGKHVCVFAFYRRWLSGETLLLTRDNFGCSGCGHWLCDSGIRSRRELVDFLVGEEGLKASTRQMEEWLECNHAYRQIHPYLLIGPLKLNQYQHLRSVTFYTNPDQLSLLMLGAQYDHSPGDPTPVIAPFGSGCMELLPLFEDPDQPQAVIGGTDIAMRKFLPPDTMAFTVTRPMFERLCRLDKGSFLYKEFWKGLQKSRERAA